MKNNANTRLEMFCDAVIAIAITLLILEIKVPHFEHVESGKDLWHTLYSAWPSWFAFALSFTCIFIAWVNHHSFFHYLYKPTMLFMFTNGFFLLTLVIFPFATALMAEYLNTEYAKPAITFYCFVCLFHNIGWLSLFQCVIKQKQMLKHKKYFKNISEGRTQTFYGFLLYSFLCILSFWFPLTALSIMSMSWVAWIVIGLTFEKKPDLMEEEDAKIDSGEFKILSEV